MRKKSLADALMPPIRQRLLALTLGTPDRWWYLSELAETMGTSPSSLQRELDSLTNAAILVMRREGRRTYYRANEKSAIYEELRGIVRKTMGIPQELETSLAPIKRKVAIALLYGSVARGEERADSDIDLLIVADDLTLEELYRRLSAVEKRLHRKVNPTLYTRDEFRRRRRASNAFLEKVLSREHIVLMGDVDDAASA
ncbi:MAG: nucleotidyltransferase domain-containing protein [Thermoanaerobaculia bacterium]